MPILLEGGFLHNSDLKSGSSQLQPLLCSAEQLELQAGLSAAHSLKLAHQIYHFMSQKGKERTQPMLSAPPITLHEGTDFPTHTVEIFLLFM